MPHAELLELNRKLLRSISQADWDTYVDLCSEDMTCFEPEAEGRLVHGLGFHKRFFDTGGHLGGVESEIVDPNVRVSGDVAIVCFVRKTGDRSFEETRVWMRTERGWKHVHFHRSAVRQGSGT